MWRGKRSIYYDSIMLEEIGAGGGRDSGTEDEREKRLADTWGLLRRDMFGSTPVGNSVVRILRKE